MPSTYTNTTKIDVDTDLSAMSALTDVAYTYMGIPENWTFPSSLVSFLCASCEFNDLRAVGTTGNLQKLEIVNTKNVTDIPSIVYGMDSAHAWIDFDISEPLTLSEKKKAKLEALAATSPPMFNTDRQGGAWNVPNFTGNCSGEIKTLNATSISVCVVTQQADDDLVVDHKITGQAVYPDKYLRTSNAPQRALPAAVALGVSSLLLAFGRA